PIRQGNAFLVRHLSLYLLQQLTLDRVGVRLVRGFEPLAVAALFFGGGEDHAGTLHGNVTAVQSGPLRRESRPDRRRFHWRIQGAAAPDSSAVGNSYPLVCVGFSGVCGSGSSLLRCRFADPGGVRVRSAFRELLESFLALVAEFHAAAAALCFRT